MYLFTGLEAWLLLLGFQERKRERWEHNSRERGAGSNSIVKHFMHGIASQRNLLCHESRAYKTSMLRRPFKANRLVKGDRSYTTASFHLSFSSSLSRPKHCSEMFE